MQTISATKNGAPIAENTETLVAKDDVITFTFNFNETTRLSGDATITLNSGGTVTLSAYDDSNPDPQNPTADYRVLVNEETPEGDSPWLDIVENGFSLGGNKLTDNPLVTWDSDNKPNQIVEPVTAATAFSTTYNIKVDGRLPTVESVTTSAYKYADGTDITQDNNRYGINTNITLKITFSEAVVLTNGNINVDLGLNSGTVNITNSDILENATPSLNNRIAEKVFTVVAADDDILGTSKLAVAGNSLPDPASTTNYLITDVAGNEMDATGRAFASSNIDDNSQIYVDADKPDTPTSITIAPDGGTVEDLADYADDYASYFNSTNTGIAVSVVCQQMMRQWKKALYVWK